MIFSLPTWFVTYTTRRPTVCRPLTAADYATVEVGAANKDGAAAAFRQRFPPSNMIVCIAAGSGLGFR